MTYTTKDGKQRNTYLLGDKRIEEMESRGWRLFVANSFMESEQELYDRLSKVYDEVRIYEASTRIRGLHKIFAMCRDR